MQLHIRGSCITLDRSEGVISQEEIIQIYKEVFGAAKSKHHGLGRRLVFNIEKLDRLGKIYNLSSSDIEIMMIASGKGGTHGTHGTLSIGLDSFVENHELNQDNNSNNSRSDNEGIVSNNNNKHIQNELSLAKNVSQASQIEQQSSSVQTQEPIDMTPYIYRLYADTWACKNKKCKQRGDYWFMKKHLCRGLK